MTNKILQTFALIVLLAFPTSGQNSQQDSFCQSVENCPGTMKTSSRLEELLEDVIEDKSSKFGLTLTGGRVGFYLSLFQEIFKRCLWC